MLECYLQSTRGIARARSSLVGPYLDGFAVALQELGYCRLVGQWCITYAVHLGLWAAAEGVPLGALDEGAVRAFLAHLCRCRCPGHRAGLHGVARARTGVFVRYLRSRGVVPIPAPPVAPPALVIGFCEWMRSQRGSAETTLRGDGAVASALRRRLGDDPACYEAGAVRAAVHAVTGGHGTATARYVAKVARGFLRYLAVAGRCRPGLDAAVLPVASWRRASLPRYVAADAVQRIIDACDATRPAGGRDRAILRLLARLGLRGGDMVCRDFPLVTHRPPPPPPPCRPAPSRPTPWSASRGPPTRTREARRAPPPSWPLRRGAAVVSRAPSRSSWDTSSPVRSAPLHPA